MGMGKGRMVSYGVLEQLVRQSTPRAPRPVADTRVMSQRDNPSFLDLHNRLSSDTTTYPLRTKVTLQGASSYIITSTPKVRLSKGVVDVSLFVI
jgi:hypothetical protein